MNDNVGKIEKLALSGKKVFTTADLAVLWQIPERRRLIELIKYYLRTNRLTHLHKGVYAYGTDYTPFDVAQKLVPFSYLSLYTTCQLHGLTFQYYETVYAVALQCKHYEIGGQKYEYHRVKEAIFYNTQGLVNTGRYWIAGRERTILDCLYVYPRFAFDNLQSVDREKLRALAGTYDNRQLGDRVEEVMQLIEQGKWC